MDKNLFTLDALSKKTGYWVGSFGRWIRDGKLTEHRVNGKKAIDYDEFVNFLSKNNIKKPYKKGPRSKIIPQEIKVETIKAEPVKMIPEKQRIIEKLTEVLELSCNNHVLTPNQFMRIRKLLEQLNEGEINYETY